jgi:hypothetical protein
MDTLPYRCFDVLLGMPSAPAESLSGVKFGGRPPRGTTQYPLCCPCSCPPATAVAHVETRKFVSTSWIFERALLLCLQNATVPSHRLALNDASAEL